jgi:RNA polymerase sigma-70 factor (ECF subfamily)
MLLARSPGMDLPMEKADRMESADGLDAASLHRRYLKEIFRYVSRRVPRQEAEDITMQVLAAALEALPRFRGDCPPHVWILGIAHRKVVDALRRRRSRREMLASELADPATGADPIAETLASAVEGPEAAVQRAEARRVIRQLVDRLSSDQREALLLQYVEGLAVAEIAGIMGRSPAAIDSLLQRARATLFRLGRPYFLDDGEELQR